MYLIDPEFGFMHVRIQGWIPYEVQIYINGREWLARQLDKAGIGYVRYDNSLLRIDDLEAAAELCDHFAHRAWPRVLNAFARMVNPLLAAIAAAGYRRLLLGARPGRDRHRRHVQDPAPTLLAVWPDLVRHAALNMWLRRRAGLFGPQAAPQPWPPRWSPTPNAAPRDGGSATAWAPTGSRSTTRPRSCGSRPSSTIRASSGSCASSPTTGPARAAVVSDEKRRQRPVAQLPGRHRRQPALPGSPRRGTTERRRRRRPGRLVPARTKAGAPIARFNPLNPADLALFKAALAGQHTINGFRNADLTDRLYRRPAHDRDEAHRRCERSPGSSSNSADTVWSPRFPDHASTASPPTDNES